MQGFSCAAANGLLMAQTLVPSKCAQKSECPLHVSHFLASVVFSPSFGLPAQQGAAAGDSRTECWNSFLSTCFMLCESSWREGINYYKLPVYAKRCLHKLLESPLELVEQCSHQHEEVT